MYSELLLKHVTQTLNSLSLANAGIANMIELLGATASNTEAMTMLNHLDEDLYSLSLLFQSLKVKEQLIHAEINRDKKWN